MARTNRPGSFLPLTTVLGIASITIGHSSPGIPAKPAGANFYPADITKAEFNRHLERNPKDAESFKSLYTIIRRGSDGRLRAIPYHEFFAKTTNRAAKQLRAAAKFADNREFKNYLIARAEALETSNYQPSDLLWMDMKSNRFDVVIGPIETYEDQLFGYKAAHEAYVLIKDISWSQRLAKYARFLPRLQQNLPVAAKYKAEKPGSNSDLNAYDVIYYAGDCNAGSKTIAINLPNDEQVQLQKGTRRLQLKNAMRAKFDRILVPISEVLIDSEQRQHITFDAFFANTMFHEVAHGLGIKNTINGKGPVRSALREQSGTLEEGKADILGLFMITYLHDHGMADQKNLMDNYVTFMASIFRSIRFGASSAHGRANLLRFNFFKRAGAFTRSANGKYRIDMAKMREAMNGLSETILKIQGDGDYAAATKLMETTGQMGLSLKADLDRLQQAGIPVDIVFAQGEEVLGLPTAKKTPAKTAQTPPRPASPKSAVTTVYHGTKVTEHYRWLEDWEDPNVKAWSEAQNQHARGKLDHLPQAATLRKQITKILGARTVSYHSLTHRNGQYFALLTQPPKQQPMLIRFSSLEHPEQHTVVVDPNVLDNKGTTSIDWFIPSPQGDLVAVSLSKAGTERGDLTIFRSRDGKQVYEQVPYVNSGTAGGDLTWFTQGDGFFYTRHLAANPDDPNDNNVYQHVYSHRLGTPIANDRYELGKGFPQIAEIQLDTASNGDVLATVQKGDGGQFAHYLRRKPAVWEQFSKFGDKIVQAVFGHDNDLYVVSQQYAPRGKIVRVKRDKLSVAHGQIVVSENKDTIVSSGIAFWGETTVLPTKDRLYVVYQLGGPSEIRVFDLAGKPLAAPKQLAVSAVHGLFLVGDQLYFGNNSFVDPDNYFVFNAKQNTTKRIPIGSEAAVDLSSARVVREFATSKDGTKIPINIILPPGVKRDGSNPSIVYGYGGYGVNITPRFRSLTKLLVSRGVIYAVANIRGGGEYGESWHRQGNLTNKQNVFDDFAAAVQHMTKRGYSKPSRTGIMGGSNGGLLMGATLTQHPEDVAAVVSLVGIYDMLRVELSPNGKFNVTEFGTVKDADQFAALYGYSPYHAVRNGQPYPPTLFLTGANDPRVDPMQSRKMTARLQEATPADTDILLRTSANTGHGNNSSLSAKIEEYTDIYAFFFHHLGVPMPKASEE